MLNNDGKAVLYETRTFKDRIPPHLCGDDCKVCEAYAKHRASDSGRWFWFFPAACAILLIIALVRLW